MITAHVAITATLVFLTLVALSWGDDLAGLLYPASWLYLAALIWTLWSWQRTVGQLFDPYVLFLVAVSLFNGGQLLLEVFHLNPDGILSNQFSADLVARTALLVVISLMFLHAGALVSAAPSRRAQAVTPMQRGVRPALHRVRGIGYALLVLSSVPALTQLWSAVRIVASGGYFALYQRDSATGFAAGPQVMATFLVPACMFLLAGGKDNRPARVISFSIVTLYGLTQLFLGYRYSGVMPMIAYAWLWHTQIRHLPRSVVAVTAASLLLVVFPLVGMTRVQAGAERASLSALATAYTSIDNPAVSILSELGGTMGTIAYTVDYVPNVRPFDMGVSYAFSLLTIMPNVFWSVHPTIAHGRLSDWLVWSVNPYIARAGGGLGYSCIAEAFLNFGWFGAPIALAIVGFLYGRLVLWAVRSRDAARLATIASFCAFFIVFARAESGVVIRPLFWYALGPYALVHFITSLRSARLRVLHIERPAPTGLEKKERS